MPIRNRNFLPIYLPHVEPLNSFSRHVTFGIGDGCFTCVAAHGLVIRVLNRDNVAARGKDLLDVFGATVACQVGDHDLSLLGTAAARVAPSMAAWS